MRRLLVSLLSGLLTAIAVSWVIVEWSSLNHSNLVPIVAGRYPCLVPEEWPSATTLYQAHSVGVTLSYGAGGGESDTPPGPLRVQVTVLAAGWPCRAVKYRRYLTLDSSTRTILRVPIGSLEYSANLSGIPSTAKPMGIRALPYEPVPLGLAANTVAYGAIAWILLWAASRIRRRLWSRRGRCLRFGYDLAGLQMCPECGSCRLHKTEYI